MSRRAASRLVAALAVLGVLWLVRPVFHGIVLFFFVNPLVWFPPLAVLVIGALATTLAGARDPWARSRTPAVMARYPRQSLRRLEPRERLVLAMAGVFFLLGAFLNGPLIARSIYANTVYRQIPNLPTGGLVRLVPREVAVQLASSGFNSPTERLTDFHIVRTPRGLAWTALRTPDGLVRTFIKKSEGLVSLAASSTERRVFSADARLQVAPGLRITDNLRWRLLKQRYLIELAEPNAIQDARGRPLILVPYLSYKGLLVRRPVLGGAFVVYPDGRIEDLSPEEARRRPEIAGSGRLFPDELARRIQDAYAYKRGILNNFFLHEEQTQITDTETNPQPYLIDFGPRGSKWVTVAEPYGRAFAMNAIFLTDSVTGSTEIWRVPGNESLNGNRRAIQTVRSVSIPGIVFSDVAVEAQDGSSDDAPRVPDAGGGRFRVVEPRPVFVGRRLVYLVSIIPESANSVSKSVIVDAARNKVVAIFNNDTDPGADAKTLRYLATGELPTGSGPDGGGAGAPERAPPDGPPPRLTSRPPAGRELERRLDRLIRQQERVLRDAQALRESLRGAGGR
jgi:hypothetical protein